MNQKTKKITTTLFIALIAASALIYLYNTKAASAQTNPWGLMITYEDGSTNIYTPQSNSLSIVDYNTGKTVASISLLLYCKPSFNGELQSYITSGSTHIYLASSANLPIPTVYNFGEKTIGAFTGASGNSMVSDSEIQIGEWTYTASQIETAAATTGLTDLYLYAKVDSVKFTATFIDESVAEKELVVSNNYVLWHFKYVEGVINSLTVSWGSSTT